MVLLTAWAMNLSTQHPERPGRVIDYLPAYDFDITIVHAVPGAVQVKIGATPCDEIAGSA